MLDAGNQPLAGVTVSLYAKERAATGGLAARSATDQYGDAYFGRLAPGSYQLTASLRGYDEYRNDVFISPGITTDFPLQLVVAPVIPINEKAVARYTVPNLPSKNVQAVFQDSEGWMWFGTDKGVARFNGADFKSSSVVGSGLEQLAGEDIRSIAEDRNGTMWIATARGVRRIAKNGDEAGPAFDVREPRQLLVDSGGAVWLTTADGLLQFDGRDLTALAHSQELRDVDALAEDEGGRIWLAAAGGLWILDGERLVTFERWRNSQGETKHTEQEEPVSGVRSLMTDKAKRLWLSTEKGMLLISSGAVQRLPIGALSSNVRAIGEDSRGRVWLAPDAGGVVVYDAARRESQRVHSFDRDHIAAIFTGREGRVWFATDNGVVSSDFYSFVSFTTSRGLADNDVQAIVETPWRGQRNVWFLTASGVSRLDGERFVPLEGFRSGISLQAVAFDSSGVAWFATNQGALRWTRETLTQFNEGSGLASNNVQWVTATARGQAVVFATTRGVSIFQQGELHDVEALAGYDTRHAFEDRDGRLWFATSRGVVSFDPKSEESSLIDASRRIWIATNKGAVCHIPVTVAPSAQVSVEVDGSAQEASESGSYNVSAGRHKITFHLTPVTMSGQTRCLYRINSNANEQRWEILQPQQGAQSEVSRLGLDEGAYSFELIALNRDLYGAKSPAATLSVRVAALFWKNWWFYALAIVAVGLALGATFAARRMQAREYVLPRELRSYVPIEPNPFIVGNPIRGEKMFYGREDDFRYVRVKLEGASQGVVIVFCGERRVGKSSILYQVAGGRLGERFIPVFVDLQEMVIASDSEFFSRLARLIAEAVARAKSRELAAPVASAATLASVQTVPVASSAETLNLPRFEGRNPYPVFLDFLDGVLDSIGDRTLLILMDEYELLEGKVDEGKISGELFTFLAGLMDNKEHLALIFTGSRRLEERDRKYWRELLRRSLFRKVGFLSEKDTARLITEPVEGRVVYGRGVVGVIYRLTAGQPFYTQVICQNLVDYLNEHRQNWVTAADLTRVISEIVDNPLPQMIYTWDALSDDEKLGLSLLGEALTDDASYATARELRVSVKSNDYPVNLSENTLRLTLEEMFRRELLEKDASVGFRFKIDLLRLWIRRSHSIWQVVKEVRTL